MIRHLRTEIWEHVTDTCHCNCTPFLRTLVLCLHQDRHPRLLIAERRHGQQRVPRQRRQRAPREPERRQRRERRERLWHHVAGAAAGLGGGLAEAQQAQLGWSKQVGGGVQKGDALLFSVGVRASEGTDVIVPKQEDDWAPMTPHDPFTCPSFCRLWLFSFPCHFLSQEQSELLVQPY